MKRRVATIAIAFACTALSGCAAATDVPIPTLDALSAAESEAIIDEQIDQSWQTYGNDSVDRPEVALVRPISRSEWGDVMTTCMDEQGFPVTVDAQGGMSSGDLPTSQADAYNVAIFTCEASYPLDPKYNAPLNESQRRYLYHYRTTALVECLKSEGYETGEPPSWQKFTEQVDAGNMWNPYTDLPNLAPRRFQELSGSCPQTPPRLYG